jgi:hypothetical protein
LTKEAKMMNRRRLSLLVAGIFAVAAGGAVAQEDDASRAATKSRATTKPIAQPQITAEQRARLYEKLRLITRIMEAAEPDMQATGKTLENRVWLRESMYGMSLEQIRSMGVPGGFGATVDALTKARANTKALGALSSDLVFFPFPPCRFIDTRNVGGKINGARGFDYGQPGSTYGGSAACSLTTLSGAGENQIAAAAVNITIVDTSTAASPGFATMRPNAASPTTALVNWTVSSVGFQLGNAAVVTNDQTGTANEIEIFTSGPVHAIVDYAGVFASPTATALSCTEVSLTQSVAAGGFTVLQPTCPAGYTLTGGGYNGASLGASSSTSPENYPNGSNGWLASFYNNSGGAFTMEAWAVCCRVPGR